MIQLINFYKKVPEFERLPVEDKMILVRRNIMRLAAILTTIPYGAQSGSVFVDEEKLPWNSPGLQQMQGAEIIMEIQKTLGSFRNLAQFDQKIVRLALVIFMFTEGGNTEAETSDTIVKDGLAVYRAQSYYIDLLWKYMEAEHGPQIAAQIFCEMLFRCISWQTLDLRVRRNAQQNLVALEIDTLPPLMKSVLNLS